MTNGVNKKKVFLIDVFSENDILQKCHTVFKMSNLRSGQGSADAGRSREEIMEREIIEYISSDWEEKEEWGIALRDKTAQSICNPTNGYLQHFDNRKEQTGDSGGSGELG